VIAAAGAQERERLGTSGVSPTRCALPCRTVVERRVGSACHNNILTIAVTFGYNNSSINVLVFVVFCCVV
jgi:hypothetical protein